MQQNQHFKFPAREAPSKASDMAGPPETVEGNRSSSHHNNDPRYHQKNHRYRGGYKGKNKNKNNGSNNNKFNGKPVEDFENGLANLELTGTNSDSGREGVDIETADGPNIPPETILSKIPEGKGEGDQNGNTNEQATIENGEQGQGDSRKNNYKKYKNQQRDFNRSQPVTGDEDTFNPSVAPNNGSGSQGNNSNGNKNHNSNYSKNQRQRFYARNSNAEEAKGAENTPPFTVAPPMPMSPPKASPVTIAQRPARPETFPSPVDGWLHAQGISGPWNPLWAATELVPELARQRHAESLRRKKEVVDENLQLLNEYLDNLEILDKKYECVNIIMSIDEKQMKNRARNEDACVR
ncbi:hypothetical protein TWF481_011208 [Arthrobotrys musiformis]|uniref:Uncharacterized protein n=1 Tax=Arthrobotrys musiformis TaxID=47236 RepID=A0AAV9VZK0_9PEZI